MFSDTIFCTNWSIYRNSRLEVFYKKSVPRNFTKFTGKHLCQSLRPAILLKKRLWLRCFPVNCAKFLRKPFLTEHLRWLASVFSLFSLQLADTINNFELILVFFKCYLFQTFRNFTLKLFLPFPIFSQPLDNLFLTVKTRSNWNFHSIASSTV